MRRVSIPRWARTLSITGLSIFAAAPLAAQGATVTGRITETGAGQPIQEARIIILGTSLFTTSGQDGKYTVRNVPAGTAEIRVIRVGFQEQKKSVRTINGETATLDFAMSQSVVQLEEVVTTATGQQRRTELGNSVTNLDANKLLANSPVTNMGDLLVAKAPGVQVLPSNMTGAGARVRVRGTASLSLSNDPIYIIDGIRMTSDNGNGGANTSISVGGTSPSRVNDLNPEDIENIEIVKGPSAATLYGTAGANGVILITTKKGRAGAPKWNFYGEQGLVQDKNTYPGQYAILGKSPATTAVPNPAQRKCLLKELSKSFSATGVGCILDSTASLNMFETDSVTPLHDGYRNEFGGQLSGGIDQIRYFASGDMQNENGPLRLPSTSITELQNFKTPVKGEWLWPEALQKSTARLNLTASPNSQLDLSLTTGFIKSDQRLPQVDNNVNSFWYNGETGPGYTKGPGYTGVGTLGQPLMGWAQFTPAEIFQYTTEEGIQRFIGSGNGNWRPLSWLAARADMGLDLTDRTGYQLCRLQQCPDFSTNRLGFATDSRANTRNFSASLGSDATWQVRNSIGFKTSVGAQYNNYQLDRTTSTGSILPPGAQTPSQGTTPSITNAVVLSKTLGLFAEEQAAWRDRMFLTVGARTDQNSAFGTNFQRVVYPKAQLSWVASDESFFPSISWLNNLRLRTAWGSSGVQPGQTDALRTLTTVLTSISGSDISGERSNLPGNANLKPERSSELETGFDSRWFGNRMTVEYTYYNKISKDALIDQVLAPSTGQASSTVKANLGKVLNSGHELLVTGQLIDNRNFGWDLTFNGSHNTNKLKSLGLDASGKPIPPIINTTTRQLEGYPVNGYWQRSYTYADSNSDGIITPNEVIVRANGGPVCQDSSKVITGQICDGFEFIGYSQPRDEASVQSGWDLFKHALRISVLVDYKGGASLYNNEEGFLCQQTTSCPETSTLSPALWKQARVIAQRDKNPVTQYGYFENLQFWRFRELTATYTMPALLASKARAQSASISFGARNLHIWTKWTGADPEQNYSQGDTQATLLTSGPPRYYTVRLNLRY
jgi:TonB-linked SusC/RagA family outer membrane protein